MSEQTVQHIANEIAAEVARARGLHAPMNSAHEAYAVILEELEEFWEEVMRNPKKLAPESQAMRLWHMRQELVQTAAMCLRAVVDLNLPAKLPTSEYAADAEAEEEEARLVNEARLQDRLRKGAK